MTPWDWVRCRLPDLGGRPRDDPQRVRLIHDLRRQATIAQAQAAAIRAARREGRFPSWEDLLGAHPREWERGRQ